MAMSILIHLDKFPRTADLLKALTSAFEQGAGVVCLAQDNQVVCAAVSQELAKETLAQRVAKRWMEDPSILQKLADRVGEQPEAWPATPGQPTASQHPSQSRRSKD